MDDELMQAAMLVGPRAERQQLPPPINMELPAATDTELTPAEVEAHDAVFSRDQEADAVANFLGLWISAAMFADMARDHFRTEPEERKSAPELKTGEEE